MAFRGIQGSIMGSLRVQRGSPGHREAINRMLDRDFLQSMLRFSSGTLANFENSRL